MNENNVKVKFTPLAWTKMWLLVDHFDSEVGWAGLCYRDAKKSFVVEDILVHKQKVTGGTVRTDFNEYDEWLDYYRENDEETFFKISLHGHSHYRCGAYPSGKDEEVQEDFTSWLDGDMFYIFIIVNRQRELWIKVYDMETKMMYWQNAVEVSVVQDDFDSEQFLAEADKLVERQTYKPRWRYYKEDEKDGDESGEEL